jgi:predicted ester cyclase
MQDAGYEFPRIHLLGTRVNKGTYLPRATLDKATTRRLAVSAENTDRLKRLLLEGFGQGDMSVLDEVVAENFIEHQQGLPQGREGLKEVIRDLRRAFPDLSYTVVQMVADGDKMWGHFRARGTNEGPFMGQDPTGKVMGIDAIDISRFEDGKMVEHWGVPDRLGTLLQLGFFP